MSAADYATAVMADAPKAYWKCQEASGFPQDSSGFGLHTTVVDTPINAYQVAGPMSDYAIEYGSGGRHRTTSIPSSATDNIAIEFWLYIVSTPSSSGPVAAWDNLAKFQVFLTASVPAARVIMPVVNGSQQGNGSASLALSTWYHIVVTRESGNWKQYTNGVVESGAAAGSVAPSGYGTITFFPGLSGTTRMAHVAMYDTALTAAKVAAHYAAATAPPPSTFVPKIIVS